MREWRPKIFTMVAAAVIAASCKPAGGRAGEAPPPPKVEKAPPVVADAKPEPAAPAANAEQKCGGYQEKLEAERRAAISALAGPYGGARRISIFMGFVDETGRLAAERRSGDLDALVARLGKDSSTVIPSWNESHEKYVTAVVREALGGYASCRALTDDDPSWCESLGTEWEEQRSNCRDTYFYFALLARKAIAGKAGCEKALAKATPPGGVDPEDALAGCKAIVDRKPESCPFEKGSKSSAICRALSARDGRGPCEEFASEHPDLWVGCCQNFAWRFANVAAGLGDPHLVPELGALSGDASGCDSGLAWEIFGPLAPLFGVAGLEGDSQPPLEGKMPDRTCPFQVRWSFEKVAGR